MIIAANWESVSSWEREHIMKTIVRAGIVVVAACILVSLLGPGPLNEAGAGQAAAGAGKGKGKIRDLSPEMKAISARVGTFDHEITIAPCKMVPEGNTAKSTMVNKWLLGGKFQQQEISNNRPAAPDAIFTVMYDPNKKVYRGFRLDDQGVAMTTTGSWDKASKSLTWTWKDPDGTTGKATENLSDRKNITWKGVVTSKAGEVVMKMSGKLTRKPPKGAKK